MAEWIETFKGAIPASEYDPKAHMNSRLYVTCFDQATWFLMLTIGVTPSVMAGRERRVAIIRQYFQLLREIRGGELIQIQSGFVAVGRKHLRFLHRMFDCESAKLIAVGDYTAVQASLKSGKAVLLSAKDRNSAEALLVSQNVAETGGLQTPAPFGGAAG